jgi:ribosomal protein S18 acetylase RimI-like enzyme
MSIELRKANGGDVEAIHSLYCKVASVEGGLARTKDEVTIDYVSSFVQKSISNGLIYLAVDSESSTVIGEIHCYTPGIAVFSHVLTELTIAVDPNYQGKGTGRMLFKKLLEMVSTEHPEILRIELIARESNTKAIAFYESLGFGIEGRFTNRIRSVGGGFEADIPMAWVRKQLN